MHPTMSKLSGRAKTVLLGSTMLASVAALCVPALAQEQGVETVVVTGIRASLQSAQAIKQNSDQVVDSITAVDIGALPDRSVAEALQRVPGVQVTRTDQIHDPLRWAGYGNGVNIRGLSWVSSLTNGFETFGAENGRTISFADISPSLMSGVDVYKNPDATMIEGGVGGVVNLKTRRPFDQDGRVIAADFEYTYGDNSNKITPSANALYSNRFNTKIGEVGVLISGDYEDLRASNGLFSLGGCDTGTWNIGGNQSTATCSGTVNGKTVYYPTGLTTDEGVGYRHLDWKQPRVTFDGTVQWRPTEKLEVTAIAIWTKAEPQSYEHNVAWDLETTCPAIPVAVSPTNPYPAGTCSQADATTPTTVTGWAGTAVYWGGGSALPNYKYDKNGNWIGGTIYNAYDRSSYANYLDDRYDARHHITGNYSLGVKYDPTDDLHLSMDAEYVDSRAYMYSMTVYNDFKSRNWCQFHSNSGPFANWGWQGNCGQSTTPAAAFYFPNAAIFNVTSDFTGSPKIGYSSVSQFADPSNYLWAAAMDHVENNYAHSWATRADAIYDFHGGVADWLKDVRVGFRADLKEATTRRSKWNWGKLTFKTWSNGWNSCCNGPQEAAAAGDYSDSLSSPFVYLYKFPTMFGNKLPAMWETKVSLLEGGIGGVWKAIKPLEQRATLLGGITGMWTPLAVTAGCDTSGIEYLCNSIYNASVPSSNGGGINNQTENTYAGYVQFDYKHDGFTVFGHNIPIDGTIGVRIVETEDNSGAGYLLLPQVTACNQPTTPAATPLDCTGKIAAANFVGNLVNPADPTRGSGSLNVPLPAIAQSYLTVLPSFNFRAALTDHTQFRAAFSRGMVRPDLSYTQNYETVGFSFGQADQAGTIVGATGNAGNPFLKPLYSNNYDASVEWYFSATGSLTFAAFYKDIKDYFKSGVANITYTRNGVSQTFATTTYLNGSTGNLKGFEIAYQQFYDFLPGALGGLGLQANYTKLWNHGGANSPTNINNTTIGGVSGVSLASSPLLPMEGMSNDTFNAAVMYEKYGISGRVAYNWRSRYLVNSSAVNLNQPVFQRNYGQFDASVLYTFLEKYKIGIQANNIFKQTTVLDIGGLPTLPITQTPHYEWVQGERKISVILRATW